MQRQLDFTHLTGCLAVRRFAHGFGMFSVKRTEHPRLGVHVQRSCAALLFVLSFAGAAPTADTVKVSGLIFTLDQNHVQTVWPGARVTLQSLSTHKEISTVSNDLGQYIFTGVLPGEYEITVMLAGFDPSARRVKLEAGANVPVDFQLVLKKRTETVQVTAEATGVDLSSSSGGTQTLNQSILKSVVRLNDDFQTALPLLPGVIRGPDGLIRIKGGQANQTNALVNSTSIADPFTGQPALKLPTAAVESMRVLSNPFSAEYGGFASGVIEVNTRGGSDEWKWLFEDPIPRLRWIDNKPYSIESATPHLAVAGPIIRDKLFLFESLAFGYDVVRVPSLPNPDNVRVDERVNTHTQLDWDITSRHRMTVMLTADPQNTDYVNIDTFNPQLVTADYLQRGFFSSASDRWIFSSGGFMQSLFSIKQLNVAVFPAEYQPGQMILFPEQNSGTYFEHQNRHSWLYQWSQNLHLRPIQWRGKHLVTFGYSFARATSQGAVGDVPITVLRQDGTVSSRITYPSPITSSADRNDLTFFVQDNWQIFSRLVLDLGLRVEHDSLSSEAVNVAPRAGFVFAPTRGSRTAIRGGVGLFYDKIPINVALFPDFPAQTVTRFAADGVTILDGPTAFTHVTATGDGRLRLPYSIGVTLQFDCELRRGLLLRLGYEQREGFREFYLNPFEPAVGGAQLRLLNAGHQSYREFLGLLRWQASERTRLFASYVHSRAWGELNDYNQFFGNIPYPLIRENQFGPLPNDAPNRVLFWGLIGLPRKLQFVPILDVHSGFPYSKVGVNWDYIGRRDEAGRFPTFVDLDSKIQYPFDFKFRGRRIQFLGGLKVANVLNHFNPRDVQQYVGSPFFGSFYNSVGRLWLIDGDFDF
jgi:hypothetical protein